MLTTHIRILGWIYTAAAALLGALGLVVLGLGLRESDAGQASLVCSILLALALWLWRTGRGLLNFQRAVRVYATVVALVFMILLNGAILIEDAEQIAQGSGTQLFHLACIGLGAYTLVVLFWPGSKHKFH